jgi:glycerol-3-phosphate dehydrogenase
VTRYFNLKAEKSDIKSVWSGLRPLVSDPKATDTAKLARDHVIEDSEEGLLSIAGGKWTTYRKMALDTIDHAIKVFQLSAPEPTCQTEQLPILGSKNYNEQGDQELVKKYDFSPDIAAYLNRTYGDQAEKIAELSTEGYAARLVDNHPVIEAEVIYAARFELAERVIDVLARRMPLALLDTEATRQAAPRVSELMAKELGWDQNRCDEEMEWTEQRLNTAL